MTEALAPTADAPTTFWKMKLTNRFAFISFFLKDSRDLWREADAAILSGNSAYGRAIYRHLSRRNPKSEENYLHVALAEYRLNNGSSAADILEAGIEKYPGSASLREYYVFVCAEMGEIDRAIKFLRLDARSPTQAHELLLNMGVSDPSIRSSIAIALKDSPDLWGEADAAALSGDRAYADSIYRHLTRRKPKSEANYLHIALAEYRLHNGSVAADILEAGIKKYPDSVSLREYYVFVCAEIREIGRAIEYLRLGAHSPMQAYELLLKMGDSDSGIRSSIAIALVEHYLAHMDASGSSARPSIPTALVEHCLKQGDVLTQWRLSDIFLKIGHHEDAHNIYKHLSERELTTQTDYYYASLAKHRLLNHKAGLEILEKGQREFPEAHELVDLGFEICALCFDYNSYQRLAQRLRHESVVASSNLEFFRMAMRRCAPITSFLNLKNLEFTLSEEEFSLLEKDFLLLLEEEPVDWNQARDLVFFCHYLDTNSAFTSDTFRILQNRIKLMSLDKKSQRVLRLLHELTPPMISWYSASGDVLVDRFIQACHSLVEDAAELNEPIVDMKNHWVPWQHIFCLVAPTKYAQAMTAFEGVAFRTWPKLAYVAPHTISHQNLSRESGERIRIGFLVHDSMPMLSGFFSHFDKSEFEMIYLRPGAAGRTHAAKDWVARAEIVEYSDVDAFDAISTIAAQKLDILIAGPSTAAVFYPMMAKLALLQMVLLEPNWTNGLKNSDYYISWAPAEPRNAEEFYKTSVAYLQHPPYWIERPFVHPGAHISDETLSETRSRLLGAGSADRIYLCANTPPKIHSEMDDIFYALLKRDPDARLVLLRGEYPPVRTLKVRLRQKLRDDIERVIFLPTLNREDAHLLLQSVHCCLDSYPICGMSSSFDAGMLGVPIVTLPAPIPFGSWTAAIYDYIGVAGLTARDKSEYLDIAIRLASNREWWREKSLEIRTKASRYVESVESSNELQHFILEAWNRKLSGLPSANWISGRWQEASVH
jgi:predicted O-linked N-acetylglucosamine transferase (SPINDLY family)